MLYIGSLRGNINHKLLIHRSLINCTYLGTLHDYKILKYSAIYQLCGINLIVYFSYSMNKAQIPSRYPHSRENRTC